MIYMMSNTFGVNNKMKRVQWLDVLRGLTMLCVMLGHCMMGNDLNRMILCFHMGLFYFISGMTFCPSSYDSFKIAMKKKLSGIVLPYLCFTLMGSLFYFILKYIGLGWLGDYPLRKVLVGIFLPVGGNVGVGVTQGFWFVYDVITIYMVSICLYFTIKYKRMKYLIPIIIYISIITLLEGYIMLSRQLVGNLLFLIGYMFFGNGRSIRLTTLSHSASFILLSCSTILGGYYIRRQN